MAVGSKLFGHLLQNLRPWNSGALIAQKITWADAEKTDALTI